MSELRASVAELSVARDRALKAEEDEARAARSKEMRRFGWVAVGIVIIGGIVVLSRTSGNQPLPATSSPKPQSAALPKQVPQSPLVDFEAQCDAQIKRLEAEQSGNYVAYQRAIQEIRAERDTLRNKEIVCDKSSAILANINKFDEYVRSSKCSDWGSKRERGIRDHLAGLQENFQAISRSRNRLGCS